MELENEINNNIKKENNQNNFLQTVIGQTINNAIDMGIRAILPDLIENQVIDIKNSLLENGLREGIKTAIDSAIDLGKSAMGIFTGNFQNMNQINSAIGNGGIIDTISTLLDKVTDKTYQLGYINKTVNSLIKKSKDVILDNVSNNIKKELENQTKSTEKLKEYIDKWKDCYKNKNFEGMQEIYNKIEEQKEKVVPLENILKEARIVENMHNLISNNGHKFELSDLEQALVKKFE